MNRILNLHEVYNHKWFEKLILYLKSKYKMVSMDDLSDFYNGNNGLDNACHITVDDGEKSFYEVIYPVLKKHQVPATLFVSPKIIIERSNYWFQEINGYDPVKLKKAIASVKSIPYNSINKYNEVWILKLLKINEILEVIKEFQSATHTSPKDCQNITTENLKELKESGLITIGAHTMNHPILKNENNLSCEFEISASVNGLSELLCSQIKYFAYPNGKENLDFTEREELILKNSGIQLAVTTKAANISLSNNKMRIPRFCITDGKAFPIVKAKLFLGSKWDYLQKIKQSEEVIHRNKLLSKYLLRPENA